MLLRHILASLVCALVLVGCHRSFGLDGERDAGAPPTLVVRDAAPPPIDAAGPLVVDEGPVCGGLPPPEVRIVPLGTTPCGESGAAVPMHDLRITAAPDLDGVRLAYNTRPTREAGYRCRIDLLGVGMDLADGQPESWRPIDIPMLRVSASSLVITRTPVCDGCEGCEDSCIGDFVLWVGQVALPAQGPEPSDGFADWLFLTDAGPVCTAPVSRCTQSLHEVEVRAELTGPATFRIRPGETRSVALGHDTNRLQVRLFDTPRSCGLADGGGELFASLAAWRPYE